MDKSVKIIESWNANADKWITTIDQEEIESRKLVTNSAIVNTILSYHPSTMIDIGCGEGWLTRTLLSRGIDAYGVDAVEALIRNAIEKGGEHYAVCSYKDIVQGKLQQGIPFDAAVINFALIDKEETESILHYVPQLLQKKGLLFIQTLHPLSIAATEEYISGWKEGSWNGMKQDFILPYQWYFRTLEDWMRLFKMAGFELEELKESIHPVTKKPLSIIFVLRCK